jgi:hypothetical protein
MGVIAEGERLTMQRFPRWGIAHTMGMPMQDCSLNRFSALQNCRQNRIIAKLDQFL